DPVELAAAYGAQGADELTFLDVTASSSGRGTMIDVVRRTAEQIFIPLTVGGGVRTAEDVDELLRAGADKVSVNTAAIARPELDPVELAAAYGAQGADELTFLDVTASSSGRGTMIDVVRRTAEQIFIPLTVGGGVRTAEDVDELLRAGADKVSVNTAAIARPE